MIQPADIKRLRQQEAWTLSDLAERLGVREKTVWLWEQGQTRPHPKTEARLARLIGRKDRPCRK